MTALAELVLWCGACAAVLSQLGVAATWLFEGRSPGAAATAAGAAVVTILGVTMLAPAPLPAWPEAPRGDATTVAAKAPSPSAPRRDQQGAQGAADSAFDWQGLRERWVIAWRRAASTVGAADPASADAQPRAAGTAGGAVLVGLAAAGAVVGIGRLVGAWLYLARLRRGSATCTDLDAVGAFREVAARLDLRRPVELRESAALATPAVIGWRRPVVLLPVGRTEWSAEQLRAVLAHELAHVARCDFAWRALAAAVRAVYFVHPLVRWLTARLALGQELAADRLAAAICGGREIYLRSLSELALRLDEPRRLRAEPLVMPAFSSNLTRRIAMLRSKDGAAGGGRRSPVGVAAAGLIALAGVGLMTLRGGAEEATPAAALTGGVDETEPAGAFSATPVDLAFLGPVDVAMFVVRPHELSRRQALAQAVPLLDKFFQSQVDGGAAYSRNLAPTVDLPAPTINLAAVDYIAYSIRRASEGVLVAKATSDAVEPGEAPQVEPIETIDFAFRFVEPVELKDWLAVFAPEIEEVSADGVTYYRNPLPNDAGTFIAQRDPHTIVIAMTEQRLLELASGDKGNEGTEEAAGFAGQWASVGGGVAAIACNFERMRPIEVVNGGVLAGDPVTELAIAFLGVNVAEGQPNPINDAIRTIGRETKTLCLGLDIDPLTNELAFRTSLACDDLATAKLVRESVDFFKGFAKSYLDAMLAANQGAAIQAPDGLGEMQVFMQLQVDAMLLGFRMFSEAETDFRLQGENRVDVWLEARGALPASFAQAITAWATMADANVQAAAAEIPIEEPGDAAGPGAAEPDPTPVPNLAPGQ